MSAVPEEATWTPDQTAAIELLEQAIAGFAIAFGACREVGIRPADALRACGIDVPMVAAPMLDRMADSFFAAAQQAQRPGDDDDPVDA